MYDLIYNILTHDRTELATHTVEQFVEQQAPNSLIDVIDDHSTMDISRIKGLIDGVDSADRHARLTVNERNLGLTVNQLTRMNDEIYDEQEFVYISDDDVLLSRSFAAELDRLIEMMKADETVFASTLFNVSPPWHLTLGDYGEDHVQKGSFGGVSALVRAADFRDAMDFSLTPAYDGVRGWDWALVHYGTRSGKKVIATRQSYVQHVGVIGVHSSEQYHDHADNFVE